MSAIVQKVFFIGLLGTEHMILDSHDQPTRRSSSPLILAADTPQHMYWMSEKVAFPGLDMLHTTFPSAKCSQKSFPGNSA